MEKEESEAKKDFRYIVRIASKDLDGKLPIYRSLWGLKGIGQRISKIIALAFEKETGVAYDSRLGDLPEDKDAVLEDIVLNPLKHGVPKWALNRRGDWETGEHTHLVMNELDFSLRKDFQRLAGIKSYRGLRHSWGLTVRGQKTKSTHRGKGGVIGVVKKDTAQAKGGKK